MLSVLIEGTLIAAPITRTGATGKPFTTANVRCPDEGGNSTWCSVIAFHPHAVEILERLAAGDTVAIAGLACIRQWVKDGEHQAGLKVTATRVMSVYEAGHRRKVAAARHQGPHDE